MDQITKKSLRVGALGLLHRVRSSMFRQSPMGFGGYEAALYLASGDRICSPCALENWGHVVADTLDASGPWQLGIVGVHWEGPSDFCAECGHEHPSEYGEVP